jgi:hypothetical protein
VLGRINAKNAKAPRRQGRNSFNAPLAVSRASRRGSHPIRKILVSSAGALGALAPLALFRPSTPAATQHRRAAPHHQTAQASI